MSDWVAVCPVAELGPGEHRVVDVDGTHVAVFNRASLSDSSILPEPSNSLLNIPSIRYLPVSSDN